MRRPIGSKPLIKPFVFVMRTRELTPPIVTDGKRKKKNWFRPGMMIAQTMPTNQARKVPQGMSGSSVLATAERTSGYGESSSVENGEHVRVRRVSGETYRGAPRWGRC